MSELELAGGQVHGDVKSGDPILQEAGVLPIGLTGLEFTPSSVRVTDPAMTYERIEEAIGRVRLARDATAWWIGDLLRFAESRYGEKYAQAMDATGLSYGRLANVVSTCERVAVDRRRDDLSFAHHEAVAALESADQSEWLETAARSSWSEAQLREALREAAVLNPPTRQTRAAASPGHSEAAETVDTARNLSVVRETLELVGAALDGGENAGEIVDQLATKLPEALRALEEASGPVRKASGEANILDQARAVVKDATTSNGFYMIPVAVFEPFKVAIESHAA